jgi:hypothetical protein
MIMAEAELWADIRGIKKPEDIRAIDQAIRRSGIAYPAILELFRALDGKASELFPDFARMVEKEIQEYINDREYSETRSRKVAQLLETLNTLAGPGHETKRRKWHWRIYELSWKMPKSPEQILLEEKLERL